MSVPPGGIALAVDASPPPPSMPMPSAPSPPPSPLARAVVAEPASDSESEPEAAAGGPECIICMETRCTPQTGRIYHPCPCSNVHVACLAEWRSLAPNAAVCPTCKTPYHLRRERWARVLGHPATAVAATTLVISTPVTLGVELVRLALGTPRPRGVRAQLVQTLGSAWRGAEIVAGASAWITVAGNARNALDREGAEAGLRFAAEWMRGTHRGASRFVCAVGTAAFCALTVAVVHHFIRNRIRERMLRAADHVLDMADW